MALPVDYDTVPVRGRYVYLDGTPATGQLRFTGKVIVTSGATDTIIVPTSITATLDASGQFTANVPATDDPDVQPNGWTYTVEEKLTNGGGRTFDIDVPLSAKVAGIDLSEVAPLSTSQGDPTMFVTLTAFNTRVAGESLPVSTGLSWTGAVDLTTLAVTARTIHATLTGNVTLTLPTPDPTLSFTVSLVLTQDATGSRTLTPPASCLSAYGVDPTLSTAGGAKDLVHLMWTGVQWVAIMGAPAVA